MFTDSSMVVEAALQGQGVGLVRLSLAADELEQGRLLRLFPRIPLLATGMSYYLVQRSGPERQEVKAFSAWVEREVASLRQLGL